MRNIGRSATPNLVRSDIIGTTRRIDAVLDVARCRNSFCPPNFLENFVLQHCPDGVKQSSIESLKQLRSAGVSEEQSVPV
jgi:hypothetical protein